MTFNPFVKKTYIKSFASEKSLWHEDNGIQCDVCGTKTRRRKGVLQGSILACMCDQFVCCECDNLQRRFAAEGLCSSDDA